MHEISPEKKTSSTLGLGLSSVPIGLFANVSKRSQRKTRNNKSPDNETQL